MTPSEIKSTLNNLVTHNGSTYIFTGAIFRKRANTGEYYYQAELRDTRAAYSLVVCDLKDVETT